MGRCMYAQINVNLGKPALDSICPGGVQALNERAKSNPSSVIQSEGRLIISPNTTSLQQTLAIKQMR